MTFTYTFSDADHTTLHRVDEDGNTLVIPVDPDNVFYTEFVESGDIANPFPEPEPLTTEEKVNKLLSDYGLTRDEMRAALATKGKASR